MSKGSYLVCGGVALLLLGLVAAAYFKLPPEENLVSIHRSDTGKSLHCDGTKPVKNYQRLGRFFKGLEPGDELTVTVEYGAPQRKGFAMRFEILPYGEIKSALLDAAGQPTDETTSVSPGTLPRDSVSTEIGARIIVEFMSKEDKERAEKDLKKRFGIEL